MISTNKLILLLSFSGNTLARDTDLFSYSQNNRFAVFGQKHWDKVSCSNIDSCTGYPNKFPHAKGFSIEGRNNCQWCPENGRQNCGLHRQSPIDLKRDRAIVGHRNEKECPDWHWMQYKNDTCSWDDMKNQFTIERHALQIHVPQLPNGDIACVERNGKRQYPRIDYSKGFPDWWWMQRIDISLPSQHIQEGHRYAGEITLAHFYEIDHDKNQLGHIGIFFQDYPDVEPWPYMDKLICAWRKEEERIRSRCGLPPVEPYGRCELFRGQDPSEEWLKEAQNGFEFAQEAREATRAPTAAPETPTPKASPTKKPTTKAPVATKPKTTAPVATQPKTKAPVETSTKAPTPKAAPPTVAPASTPTSLPTASSTETPTRVPTPEPADNAAVAESISCGDYNVNFGRMCFSTDPCCEATRSDTSFCWNIYENVFPGGLMKAACMQCCPGKEVADPTPELALMPKTFQCSSLPNPNRLCKTGSCCSNPRSTSQHCLNAYETFGEDMKQICRYCCSEPQDLGPELRRNLRAGNNSVVYDQYVDGVEDSTDFGNNRLQADFQSDSSITVESNEANEMDDSVPGLSNTTLALELETDNLSDESLSQAGHATVAVDYPAAVGAQREDEVPKGAKVIEVGGRKFLLREENFEDEEHDDEETFLLKYEEHQKRRKLGSVHELNYDDIPWEAYAFMVEVGTEYYFRYEGTMMVPPCWEVVHHRVMKDPIRLHPRQVAELNRLLAQRRDPDTCFQDTAGIRSGDTVDVSREVQYYHKQHRKVFCECKDWPSKFPNDKAWCSGWRNDQSYKRFYDEPYSFDSNGEWLP